MGWSSEQTGVQTSRRISCPVKHNPGRLWWSEGNCGGLTRKLCSWALTILTSTNKDLILRCTHLDGRRGWPWLWSQPSLWLLASSAQCTGVLESDIRQANVNKDCSSTISSDLCVFGIELRPVERWTHIIATNITQSTKKVSKSFTPSFQLFDLYQLDILAYGLILHFESLSIHILWTSISFWLVDTKELRVSFGAVKIYCNTVLIFN